MAAKIYNKVISDLKFWALTIKRFKRQELL